MAVRGLLTALLIPLVSASYESVVKYSGASFFDDWTFFTAADPTAGFVQYVDQATAQKNGLISTAGGKAYMGVDYTSKLNPNGVGRQSVRITSKRQFTEGLFIADLEHMPGSICGAWPAWWTVGGDWPSHGEIDIIEGVNSAHTDLTSLHTGADCTVSGTGETGTLVTNNCYQDAAGENGSGCGVRNPKTNSYGDGFNAGNGGVYAMEWTGTAIKVWFFPRGSIPADVSTTPTPANWGEPAVNFQGACNIPNHFTQHQIVFDTTFCGQWAGAVWGSDATCSSKAATCNDYVADNPAAFKDAYWSVNYVQVFQINGKNAASEQGINAPQSPAEQSEASIAATSSVVPLASKSPEVTSTIRNVAMGGASAPVAGVTPGKMGETSMIHQIPATANLTQPDLAARTDAPFIRRARNAGIDLAAFSQ